MRLVILIFGLLLVLSGCGGVRVGRSYGSQDDLEKQLPDFVVVGHFGDSWPATVTNIVEGESSVDFTRANGQKHSYSNFPGYHLRVIQLEADTGQTNVVFRSLSRDPSLGEAPMSGDMPYQGL